jgi:hypothetical protein
MNSQANASNTNGGGATGDCVKAYEVLSENLIHQLGDEMVIGLQIMLLQARELVSDSRGYASDEASVMFQALESVHDWPGLILMAETQRIVQNKPTLPTINAATMVAGTQVLFAIRPVDYSDESRGTFDLKAPDLSVLIHSAYRIVALELMHRFDESPSTILKHIHSGNIDVRNLCRNAVKEAIPRALPLNDIIRYLMGDDVGRLVKSLNDQIRKAGADNSSSNASTTDVQPEAAAAAAAVAAAAAATTTAVTANDDDDDDVHDDEARVVRSDDGDRSSEASADDDDLLRDDDDDDASLASGSGGGSESSSNGDRDRHRDRDRDRDRNARNEFDSSERRRGDDIYYRDRNRDRDRDRDDDAESSSSSSARNDDPRKKRRFF